jgi:hypothetical protein
LLHQLGPHDLSIVRDSYTNCTFQHFSIFVLDISRFLSNLSKCGTTPTLMEKFVKYKEQCHGSKTTSSCKIRLSKPYSLIFIKNIFNQKSNHGRTGRRAVVVAALTLPAHQGLGPNLSCAYGCFFYKQKSTCGLVPVGLIFNLKILSIYTISNQFY